VIPGSEARKLEAMTGGVVSHISAHISASATVPWCLWFADNDFRYFSKHRDEKAACADLRRQNWAAVCQQVFAAQKWLCTDCHKRLPLQGHHKVFRSRWRRSDGPLDVASNVAAVCAGCHERRHGAQAVA